MKNLLATCHTPGPWMRSCQVDEFSNPKGQWEITGPWGPVGEMHSLADAQLVSTAPELLASLSWVLEQIDYQREIDPESCMIAGARDVIHRARGVLS